MSRGILPNSVTGSLRLMALCLCVYTSTKAHAYDPPRNLVEGWDGKVEVGALATFGDVDTSALQARADFTYRGKRWEHELNSKFYRSNTQLRVPRRNEAGDEITDDNGETITDLVRSTNNDRRFVSVQPRWFLSSRYYVFGILDIESNKPIGVEISSRQITGIGYKLWKARNDFISAAVGIGRKKLEAVSGDVEQGAIGYVGFRFNRIVAEGVSLTLDLDSEFGGENRFSEMELGLGWSLRDPYSVKLKYSARFNSNIANLFNTFDNDLESALSINLAVDVF